MTFKKILTTAVVSASIAAGSLIPMASAANAGNWNKGRSHGYERSFKGGDHGRRFNRHHDGRQYGYGYGHRRHHRDNTGRNLAIGAFATILGLAIAAEASRNNRDYYEERY
jgi:hypothetical protein